MIKAFLHLSGEAIGLIVLLTTMLLRPAEALTTFTMEAGSSVYGRNLIHLAKRGETLLDIARHYDLGYNQITGANPGVDPWLPGEGARIVIPARLVIPSHWTYQGIVVNMAEMRLYYFPKPPGPGALVYTCPVGIGREGFSTRDGVYTVRSKAKDPVWYVPPSVLKEDPEMPRQVEPGPDNPLGGYILRFSRLAYGIHGTNRPWGVGRRVSHGCIRLYPEDIEELFPLVPVGTLIHVTYEPIKVGFNQKGCWLQAFEDFESRTKDPMSKALEGISGCMDEIGAVRLDLTRIRKGIEDSDGVAALVAPAKGRQAAKGAGPP